MVVGQERLVKVSGTVTTASDADSTSPNSEYKFVSEPTSGCSCYALESASNDCNLQQPFHHAGSVTQNDVAVCRTNRTIPTLLLSANEIVS